MMQRTLGLETTAAVCVTRQSFSCKRCGEWFYATADPKGVTAAPCPVCGGRIVHRGWVRTDGTAVHTEQRLACNGVCQTAAGDSCDCQCGGKNHGVIRNVTITVADGKTSLSLDHPEQLAHLAAKRLPDIELAEKLAEELAARADEVFGDVLPAYRAGGWLPRPQWDRVQEWSEIRRRIRHAQKLRTPSGRLRSLGAISDELYRLAA